MSKRVFCKTCQALSSGPVSSRISTLLLSGDSLRKVELTVLKDFVLSLPVPVLSTLFIVSGHQCHLWTICKGAKDRV